MALKGLNIDTGRGLDDGTYRSVVSSATTPDFATVTSDVATAVADGASPTQAHVTAIDTSYTALTTAVAPSGNVVTIIWDAGAVTTKAQIKAALDAAWKLAQAGYGGLT